MVEGPGGILTPEEQPNTCTYYVSKTCREVVGQIPHNGCHQYAQNGTTTVPQPPQTYWNVDPADYPPAQLSTYPYTATTHTDPNDPSWVAHSDPTTQNKPRIDLVIEVNDDSYIIPAGTTVMGLPGWLAYVVFAAEVVGGVMLVLGVQARWVALALTPIVIGATWAHSGNGWVFLYPNGGWEYPAYLTLLAIFQCLLGDGRFALVPSWPIAAIIPRLGTGARA